MLIIIKLISFIIYIVKKTKGGMLFENGNLNNLAI